MPERSGARHAGFRLLILGSLVWGLLCASSWNGVFQTFGQSRTTSALAGRVIADVDRTAGEEEEEADTGLEGAAVQIVSPALIGGPRVARTDAQGRYRFPELPPGVYEVAVTLTGHKTIRIEGVHLSVGLTADLTVRMALYAGEETVHVQAEAVAIDPTSSSAPTILPQTFLRNIPMERDPTHILDLAPGINLESAYGGGEESGNAYEVDGVDISDPQAGAPWSLFNMSLLDEVQLIGLGAPAEYGQFTGVVFNSVTKSGGNEFSGSTELFYTGKGLTSSNSSSGDLSATIEKSEEATFQVGGPLRKDRLWYFASGEYVRNLSSEGGPIETEKTPRLFAKVTWQATPRNTIQVWGEWDHTKISGRDGDAFTPIEATTGENNPEFVWNLSWKSVLSSDSILSVAWAGYSGYHHFDPHSGFSTPGRRDAETDIASDNARLFGVLDRDRNQINASLAHHVGGFIKGDHDFKLGLEIERSVVHDRFGFPGGAFFADNEGPAIDPSTGDSDMFTLNSFGGGYDARGKNGRISLYAQDSWRITPRFTLNPGLRLDVNRGSVRGATVFKTNSLAPRIGFAWDLEGDGESVLRAHYGRYYEALYAAFYYYTDPGAFEPLTTSRTFNTSGFTETLTTVPGQQYAMDGGIKQPYLDQYILGFERQIPHGIVLAATLVYRRNADLIETVSRDGQFVPVRGEVPETGQQVTLFDYLNPNTDVLFYTNPRGLKRTYRGVILSATRRLSGNWQLEGSYVYSRTRGNIDNLGFDEQGIGANTPFFDGRFLDTPNSLVNAQGRLTHDQTHQVKLQGTRIIPSLHLSLSADYTFHSGDTWTPRSDCLLTDDGNGVLGDGIVDCHSFPQGPVLYFAEPRGSRRLPSRNELDLRAEWQHDLGGRRELHLDVDVFNLNNQGRATEVETTGEEAGNAATFNFPRNVRFGLGFSW